MQPAALILPKRTGYLIDGGSAGRNQPFHVQFGRGLEKFACYRADRFDVKFWNDFTRQQRSFDFEESTFVEKCAQSSEQRRTLLKCGERCAWRDRIVTGLRLHVTLLACGRAKSDGDTS